MRIFFISLLAVLLLSACQGLHDQHEKTHENNAASQPPKTEEDSLYREVIALHDAVMPKMGKLIGYKKLVQAKIDSLDRAISGKKNEAARDMRAEYQQLFQQLTAAEKSMNDWMDQFNPDPKLPAKEDMIRYFEDQKAKAANMKQDVLAALDSAAANL
jgi:hypothetical protein